MITFLFWNLNRKPLQEVVTRLVRRHAVDVLMLAECNMSPDHMLAELNTEDRAEFFYAPTPIRTRVEIFTRFTPLFLEPVDDDLRLSVRHLKLPGQTSVLLAVAHLPSKLAWSDSGQTLAGIRWAEMVRQAEKKVGHSRTVLVGDLNMSPFEDGIVSANGFHAVMSRDIALRQARRVLGVEYPFFYNPMWGLFGDTTRGPSGTYYRNDSEMRGYFWYLFDQVLIRPDLLSAFSYSDLEVLTTDGEIPFLNSRGVPNTDTISDHLPLLFKLSL